MAPNRPALVCDEPTIRATACGLASSSWTLPQDVSPVEFNEGQDLVGQLLEVLVSWRDVERR